MAERKTRNSEFEPAPWQPWAPQRFTNRGWMAVVNVSTLPGGHGDHRPLQIVGRHLHGGGRRGDRRHIGLRHHPTFQGGEPRMLRIAASGEGQLFGGRARQFVAQAPFDQVGACWATDPCSAAAFFLAYASSRSRHCISTADAGMRISPPPASVTRYRSPRCARSPRNSCPFRSTRIPGWAPSGRSAPWAAWASKVAPASAAVAATSIFERSFEQHFGRYFQVESTWWCDGRHSRNGVKISQDRRLAFRERRRSESRLCYWRASRAARYTGALQSPCSWEPNRWNVANCITKATYKASVFACATASIASQFAVTGFVRNLPDGRVHLAAEGRADELDRFLAAVASELAGHIRRSSLDVEAANGEFTDFRILHG